MNCKEQDLTSMDVIGVRFWLEERGFPESVVIAFSGMFN